MDKEASSEKNLRFCGYARVGLEFLNFGLAGTPARQDLVDSRVLRLLNIFRIDQCRRYDEANFTDGVVDAATLENALAPRALFREPPSDWDQLPRLEVRIDCLNGKHRSAAAEEFLSDNDKWWIIRIHTKGT